MAICVLTRTSCGDGSLLSRPLLASSPLSKSSDHTLVSTIELEGLGSQPPGASKRSVSRDLFEDGETRRAAEPPSGAVSSSEARGLDRLDQRPMRGIGTGIFLSENVSRP